MGTVASDTPVARYFASIDAALAGLDVFLRDTQSPLYRHGLVAQALMPYVARLDASFDTWLNRLNHSSRFKISRAESGFPVFQHVLELQQDQRTAETRLAAISSADQLRDEMADFILRHKAFPADLQASMAERLYLEAVKDGDLFGSFVLPETIKVSVNPKTKRPYYMTHWGAYDGSEDLPMIYTMVAEDSSPDMVRDLVSSDGKLKRDYDIPLPIGGLLNPTMAKQFDQIAEANAAYSLSPVTIAKNIDEAFDNLHPKQLRRIVLGPFYSAGITANNDVVNRILNTVRDAANAWLLTWTVQDVFSKSERPAKRGLWSSEPAREEFHIETDDLDATRMGVSAYEKHALVPHEAYQALYAEGEAAKVFDGYDVHIIANGQVISAV
ncbi:MAG: hypothetical protein AAF940_01150 [Pseudomonadota bacterium]